LGFPFRTHPLGTYKKPSVQESLLAHITSYIVTFKTATKNIFRSKLLILSMMFFVATCFLVKSEKVLAATIYSQPSGASGTTGSGNIFWYPTALGEATHFRGYFSPLAVGTKACLLTQYGNGSGLYTGGSFMSTIGEIQADGSIDVYWNTPYDFISTGSNSGSYLWSYFRVATGAVGDQGDNLNCDPGAAFPSPMIQAYYNGSVSWTGNGSAPLFQMLVDDASPIPPYQDTHIISLTPGGFSATTSPFTFSFDFYNGTTTPEGDLDFQLRDQNINRFDPLGQLIREDHAPLTYIEGTHTYSASFTAYPSNYSLTATIFDRLGNVVEATTTYFSITSDSSGLGGQPFYGSYATTTGFFYGGFSEASSTNIVIAALSNVVTGMKYKIPWGYAFLIYDRISMDLASTSQSVPTFTMTIPGTSVITTSHSNQDLTFNLNHVGDIYATTTIMANGSTFKSQFDGIVRGILWAMFAWSVWVYFVHRRNQEIV